jgi:predicted nuclease of restriction endonuclease-like (RecB) superfamily
VAEKVLTAPKGYLKLLQGLKARIQGAQFQAAVAVNRELILLYWQIGADILARHAFPKMQGLSARNLKYMRAFAEAWSAFAIVQTALAQLTWYHNLALIEKIKSPAERLWYAHQAVEHGWSRNVLVDQIDTRLHKRQGKALTNFRRTLPDAQSELAQQLVKDPYNFEFLPLGPALLERELERGLITHLRDLIMELGKGFAFVGSQYQLEIGAQDYYLDLLFYHLKLRCFVIIELKIEEFKPEFAGKMNFYLSAVDDLLRQKTDQPSIGIILCKGRNEIVMEYALRDTRKPVGVAQYRMTDTLPKPLQQELPHRAISRKRCASARSACAGRRRRTDSAEDHSRFLRLCRPLPTQAGLRFCEPKP